MWSYAVSKTAVLNDQYMCVIPSLSRGVLTVSPFIQHNFGEGIRLYIY